MDTENDNQSNPINELVSYIEKLGLEKEASIKEGNYDYAEEITQKLAASKKSLSEERRRQLNNQHIVEVDSLDASYQHDLENFNSSYQEKFKKLEEKSKSLEEALNQKHTKEMEELYTFLEAKLPKNVKYSKTYLDLKLQEENLVKLGDFKEASKVKKKLELSEKADTEKFNTEKFSKIKSESVRTVNKHTIEKNALKKKVEIEFEVLKKEREKNLEQLLLKYKNRKCELENQQKKEISYLENENLLKKSKTFYYFRNYYK